MAHRSRFLVPLLALSLVAPVVPVTAQSNSRTLGEVLADGMSDAAAAIGSMQDAIDDMAAGIDPSDPDGEVDPGDPDGEVDPGSPSDGDAVDPGDIDPSDPGANPGDPIEPTEPDGAETGADDGDDGSDDGIELPEPNEPEDGGYLEIQLIPDPVPKAGRWKATNKVGTSVCTGKAGGRKTSFLQKIRRTTETGRLVVKDEGRTLIGRGLAEGQTSPLELTWDPESERFKGSVRVAAPGGRTKIRFDFRVIDQNRLEGELVANVRVNAQGVKATCVVARGVSLKRQ